MQKQVSRQSLAIVALTIILTLAIALSFTFAAFQDSKKVTGTITYTEPDLTITLNAIETTRISADGENLKFALSEADFDYTYVEAVTEPEAIPAHTTMTIKQDVATAILTKGEYIIDSSVLSAYVWTVTVTYGAGLSETTFANLITVKEDQDTHTVAKEDAMNEVMGNLAEVIQFNTIDVPAAAVAAETGNIVTITFDAHYIAA